VSLTLSRRRVNVIIPETWLGRMKTQAIKASTKARPMAGNARKIAAHRVVDARVWAAPKLDQAAHSVEDQLAPKVSAFLTEAARRVDPLPRTRRRWPLLLFLAGATLGAIGVAMYRGNPERWTHTTREALKETASETGKWAGEKTEETGQRMRETADEMKRS
jgi:hypothetical protein